MSVYVGLLIFIFSYNMQKQTLYYAFDSKHVTTIIPCGVSLTLQLLKLIRLSYLFEYPAPAGCIQPAGDSAG